jgi:hypothetical protein
VWVLNLIGVAHDSPEQPDALAYRGREAVLAAYAAMWALAVGAVNMLFDQGHIDAVTVYNVGGGAFCGSTFSNFVTDCFEPTFLPAAARFRRGVRLLGFDELLPNQAATMTQQAAWYQANVMNVLEIVSNRIVRNKTMGYKLLVNSALRPMQRPFPASP